MNKGIKKEQAITLIALVVTIVLNCSCLAMVEMKKRIEKNKNLVYNRLCNQKLQKYCIGGFLDDKRRVVEENEGRYEDEKFFALLI